jgi:predicted transcriptional regulator
VEALNLIERVAEKTAPGRAPSFTKAHVITALEVIGEGRVVGRIRLSKVLGLGEGETRTLLKHLRNQDLIKVSRLGIALSKFGEKIFSELRSQIAEGIEVPGSPLTVGPFNVAVLVRGAARKVRSGLEQRDAAIKVGALGATTMAFRNNRLIMPGVDEEILRDASIMFDLLVSKLGPKENDVIIIGSANYRQVAEFGAKMAALELLKPKEQ